MKNEIKEKLLMKMRSSIKVGDDSAVTFYLSDLIKIIDEISKNELEFLRILESDYPNRDELINNRIKKILKGEK